MGKYRTSDQSLQLEEEMETEPPRTSQASATQELEKGSKIIKNGNMKFEVTNLEDSKSKVDSLIKSVNAYYENEMYNSYGNRISYSLKIRIPNAKFDSLIIVFEKGIGDLKSKNINAKDVTEEYVDLNVRLENNLAYLSQYQLILKKANSIKEILEVREKIRRIEEEIESKKGRLKYLDDKVNYSTLNLELSELISREVSNSPSFGRRLLNSFNNGIQVFLSFIIGLVNFWPFLVLLFLLFIARRPILSKIRKSK